MNMSFKNYLSVLLFAVLLSLSCNNNMQRDAEQAATPEAYVAKRLTIYEKVKLTTDTSLLSASEKQMIPLFIEVAKIMDDLYWQQAYGNKDSLLNSITDEKTKEFAEINYGPWDRLNADTPFVAGFGAKPKGANFYPADMTKEELDSSDVKDKRGLYSIIRRDAEGRLESIPYHEAYRDQLQKASALLKRAAVLAEDEAQKKYLDLRSEALLTDNYNASDIAWLDMKNNGIDIITGPIETYEDKLFGARAAFETFVLVKDKEWSKRLAHYVNMLPELQAELPVDDAYKKEKPGTESELNAYDVVYYAGSSNAGSKTIAVNLPNDEVIQKTKGTRRSQLKNAMKAKFDKILLPIARTLIDDTQISNIDFESFFSNVMFHEVAHGLGVKNTINGKGTVRSALQEQASALEEAKADVLGLYMVTKLAEKGELQGELKNFYTTYMAGLLRSVRFGATSAHGRANMLEFNFFKDNGAFEKTPEGKYKVNYDKFRAAMNDLGKLILTLQGNGDKAGVEALMKQKGVIETELQMSLDKLNREGIPVDIIFEQGTDVFGSQ